MARNLKPPRLTTPISQLNRAPDNRRQLAALATLLGLMQAASKLSSELDALVNEVSGSLEQIADTAGVPFFEVHQEYVRQADRPKRKRVTKP